MKLLFLLFSLLPILAISQRLNSKAKAELGLFAGGSYYIGDLNQMKHFQNTKFSGGIVFKYNINPRLALRSNAIYGKIEANDNQSGKAVLNNRNLSFQTEFYEFSTGVEFNFAPYQTGHSNKRISPYIFAQLALFKFNPKTNFNGDLIELQPLGTEGQGTELSSKKQYKKTQISLPIGVGCKFSVSRNLALGLEFGVRKTFTDYLDDVGSNKYIDRNRMEQLNGPLVAELSNRSLDQNQNGSRGNASTKDWYFVFGMTLTRRLGPPDKCFHH